MSETSGDRQTGINNRAGAQFRSIEGNSRPPGSRSSQAGREFLKALASDLGAAALRFRLWLFTRRRGTRPSRPPAASPALSGSTWGRAFRFVGIALFGFVSISALVVCGFTLWVLYGTPIEPRKSEADTLASQFEARKGESPPRSGPLKIGETSPPVPEPEPAVPAGAQPSIVLSGTSGSVPAERQTAPPTGTEQRPLARTETQDSRAPWHQPEMSRSFANSPPRMQCSLDLCAARYASFNAADCSYQPYGGGPRRICELGSQSTGASPHTSPAAPGPSFETREARVAEKAGAARSGAQCSVNLCSARYASFHAADCTYQPLGGGPRRMCELSARSSDAPRQASLSGADPRSETEDTRVSDSEAELPKSAMRDRAGAQCNADLCAARYASFRAADCTYQPLDGGPRRICER